MHRYAWILICCLFGLSCLGRAKPEIHETLKVDLHEILTISALVEDPNQGPLIGLPNFVTTDSVGNIYVGDELTSNVKVYDSKGAYLQIISGRGREDGKLLHLTAMYMTARDELIIADNVNARITRFSMDGNVLSTHPFDHTIMLWPRRFTEIQLNEFAFIYAMPSDTIAQENLIHVFDSNFSNEMYSFIPASDYGDIDHPFVASKAGFNPGYFRQMPNGDILYAPYIYEKRIYRYIKKEGGWKKSQVIEGHTEVEEAIIHVDERPYPQGTTTIRAEGVLAAIVKSESLGVFTLKDGRIIHFTSSRFGNYRVVGVELFSQKGDFIGYGILDNLTLKNPDFAQSPFWVSWKDQQDKFYFLDRRSPPAVIVANLEITQINP